MEIETGQDVNSVPAGVWSSLLGAYMNYYDMVILGMPGNIQARRREVISSLKMAFYIFSKKIRDTEKMETMFKEIQNGNIPDDQEIVENVEHFLTEIRNRKLIKIFE